MTFEIGLEQRDDIDRLAAHTPSDVPAHVADEQIELGRARLSRLCRAGRLPIELPASLPAAARCRRIHPASTRIFGDFAHLGLRHITAIATMNTWKAISRGAGMCGERSREPRGADRSGVKEEEAAMADAPKRVREPTMHTRSPCKFT